MKRMIILIKEKINRIDIDKRKFEYALKFWYVGLEEYMILVESAIIKDNDDYHNLLIIIKRKIVSKLNDIIHENHITHVVLINDSIDLKHEFYYNLVPVKIEIAQLQNQSLIFGLNYFFTIIDKDIPISICEYTNKIEDMIRFIDSKQSNEYTGYEPIIIQKDFLNELRNKLIGMLK